MRVIIQLALPTALELHQRGGEASSPYSARTRELLQVIAQLKIPLEPLHPGQMHPLLAPFFVATVTDQLAAEQVISQLSSLEAVEAAYLKPEEGLP